MARGQLLDAAGEVLALRAQSADVLSLLAGSCGEIVSKDTLFGTVWSDTFVTDDSLIQCISEIRRAIDDKDRRMVRTYPKKGYALVPPEVDVAAQQPERAFEPTLTPRIAVLAFDDLSNGADRGFLSDAIAEAITAELSRFGEFSVIARNSSFRYRGTATDMRDIGAELGVLYVVEGSQQKDSNRLRVVAQLIDARSGKHIWAETYERVSDDLFAVQSEIAAMISASVGFQAAYKAPRSGGLAKQSALRYHLQARESLQINTADALATAEALNLKAIEVEPASPYGYIGMGFVCHHRSFHSQSDTGRRADLALAAGYAQDALVRAPQNYSCYFVRGSVHREAGEMQQARLRFERAIELNPGAANVRMAHAHVLSYLGHYDEAVALAEQVMRINPAHPEWYYRAYAMMLFRTGAYLSAQEFLAKMAQIFTIDNLLPAAIYLRLGRAEDAAERVARYLQDYPDHSIACERGREAPKYADPAMLENWLDALRSAGLPEG